MLPLATSPLATRHSRMTDRFVTLLRHGEVQGGARFRGGHDDPLSEAGWMQMRAIAERQGQRPPRWTRIVSSPARRCAEFAGRYGQESRLAPTLSWAFAERCFGDWEGLAAHQIPAAELTRFWDDPAGYTPPGAEPFDNFRTRVLTGWNALVKDPDPHTLLVTHGGAIRVIVASLLGLADPTGILIEVPLACVTRVRLPPDPGRASLMFHGDPHG
jgi:alpha-ribazole phosphatase